MKYVYVSTKQSVEKSMHTPVNNYAEQQESMYIFQPNHLKKKICPPLQSIMQNKNEICIRFNQTICRKRYAHTCKELCRITGEYVHFPTKQSGEKSMYTLVNN